MGNEAKPFHVTPSGAKAIDPNKDHISIRLVAGWTSAQDNFFQALLSRNDKLTLSVASSVTNFDGTAVNTVAFLLENSDIGRKVDKPWGADRIIVDRVPSDLTKMSVNLRAAIDKSSRFAGVLNAFAKNSPPTLELGAAEWFGYTKALVAVIDELFGTDKAEYPFIWTGDLRGTDITSEYYIVLIAKNGPNDNILDDLDDSNVTFRDGQVKVKGQALTKHSHAVLHIRKTDGYNIAKMTFESKAPWATLALSSFLGATKFTPKNIDELQGLAATRMNDLDNELVLLKEEPRFSAYDRALALYTFASMVRSHIVANCTLLNISMEKCPTAQIDGYMKDLAERFGLPDNLKTTLPKDANTLFLDIKAAGLFH